MNLSEAVSIFVKLAADASPAQVAQFNQAIFNTSPMDPGLAQDALTLERWKNENQTNPSVMVLSSRITNIRRNADDIRNLARMPEPNYQLILDRVQVVINEMQVLFDQQLRWPEQTVPIVKRMRDNARYIMRFARAALAGQSTEGETPAEGEVPAPTV